MPAMTIKVVRRACKIVGGVTALAHEIGVTPPTVAEWLNGKRRVPPGRCPQIERATSGSVRCEQLRPDIDWAVLRRPPKPRK